MIPKHLISIFDHKELELIISGLPEIDVDDLRAHTEYKNYDGTELVIKWFWEVLYNLNNQDKAEFLQFVTGSSKVPIQGFSLLQGMRGPQKFNIVKLPSDDP